MNSEGRIHWEVRPSGRLFRRWVVARKRMEVGFYFLKRLAVMSAVAGCQHELKSWGQRSELLIKGEDGRIQDARTYGDDPADTKG